jgi:hypothetical protein
MQASIILPSQVLKPNLATLSVVNRHQSQIDRCCCCCRSPTQQPKNNPARPKGKPTAKTKIPISNAIYYNCPERIASVATPEKVSNNDQREKGKEKENSPLLI